MKIIYFILLTLSLQFVTPSVMADNKSFPTNYDEKIDISEITGDASGEQLNVGSFFESTAMKFITFGIGIVAVFVIIGMWSDIKDLPKKLKNKEIDQAQAIGLFIFALLVAVIGFAAVLVITSIFL